LGNIRLANAISVLAQIQTVSRLIVYRPLVESSPPGDRLPESNIRQSSVDPKSPTKWQSDGDPVPGNARPNYFCGQYSLPAHPPSLGEKTHESRRTMSIIRETPIRPKVLLCFQTFNSNFINMSAPPTVLVY